MSLPHALLTSLLEKPCSGAELARRFDKSIGHFWQATHQQIYRELARLDAAGWIRAQGHPTARGSRRHFAVLDAGRAELTRWTRLEMAPASMRDPLLVRLRAAAALGTVDVLPEIRRHQELHAATLVRYRAVEARDFPAGATRQPGQELQVAVLRAGIALEQAWLAWCAQTLREAAANSGAASTQR